MPDPNKNPARKDIEDKLKDLDDTTASRVAEDIKKKLQKDDAFKNYMKEAQKFIDTAKRLQNGYADKMKQVEEGLNRELKKEGKKFEDLSKEEKNTLMEKLKPQIKAVTDEFIKNTHTKEYMEAFKKVLGAQEEFKKKLKKMPDYAGFADEILDKALFELMLPDERKGNHLQQPITKRLENDFGIAQMGDRDKKPLITISQPQIEEFVRTMVRDMSLGAMPLLTAAGANPTPMDAARRSQTKEI